MARSGDGAVYPRRNKAGETIGWIADVQWGKGKTAERVRRSRPTEAAAEALRRDMIAARDAGYTVDVYGLTMLDLMQRFIHAKTTGAPGVKKWGPRTVRDHEGYAALHILPYLKDKPLSDVGAHDCNFVVNQARYDEDGDERVATPHHVCRMLVQAIRWGYAEKLFTSIAFLEDVRRPHYAPEPRREFTSDEIDRIIDVVRDRPDAAMWLLMLERGPRSGEVRGILRPNIDRRAMTIKLTHQVSADGGASELVPRLKNRRAYRDVPISAYHLELIDRQIAHLQKMRENAPAWRERGLLFPGLQGQPMDGSTLHARWEAILKAAKVDYAPPHCCRHTATSRMLRHIPLVEVAAIVGDTPATLLRTYAHAQVETARPALERLDARAVGE